MSEQLSLQDYYDKLSKHDWTYMMSDDHSVWKRGEAAHSIIQQQAKTSPEHQALYDAYRNHIWKSEPRPERPK